MHAVYWMRCVLTLLCPFAGAYFRNLAVKKRQAQEGLAQKEGVGAGGGGGTK